MRIGFMGGTFSPPHIGHFNAAKDFYRDEKLDRLIIIPARVSPFKADSKATATDSQRFDMARLCFKKLSAQYGYNVDISKLELENDDVSYTYITIRKLKELYTPQELIMYVGSDMFLSLEKWKNASEIFSSCTIYTHRRQKSEADILLETKKRYEKLFGAKIHISPGKEVVISSTDIRREIQSKKSSNCQNLLTDEVLRYIIDNGLYLQENYEQ